MKMRHFMILLLAVTMTGTQAVPAWASADGHHGEEWVDEDYDDSYCEDDDNAAEVAREKYARWGDILQQYVKDKAEDTVYAQGKNAQIMTSDVEKGTEFYILTGMKHKKARKKAVAYEMEREALYQKAVAEGYSVTDQEIQDSLEELKNSLAAAEEKANIDALIGEFEDEQDYWELQMEIYKKDLPIQRYQVALEQAYYEKINASENPKEEESWEEYYEKYKEKLVKAERYKIL